LDLLNLRRNKKVYAKGEYFMGISIEITYNSPVGKVLQRGNFPLKGKLPEVVAFDWWKDIRRNVYTEELILVVVNGDEDITEKVTELIG
jgi:hypothetical protein